MQRKDIVALGAGTAVAVALVGRGHELGDPVLQQATLLGVDFVHRHGAKGYPIEVEGEAGGNPFAYETVIRGQAIVGRWEDHVRAKVRLDEEARALHQADMARAEENRRWAERTQRRLDGLCPGAGEAGAVVLYRERRLVLSGERMERLLELAEFGAAHQPGRRQP